MRKKILFALLVIALSAGLVVGGTMAWFTAKAELENEFIAGEVRINPGEVIVSGDVDITNWNPGDCTELRWEIHNSGTKDIRVRIQDGAKYGYETAMARMNDDPNDFTYQWTNHPWFSYLEYVTYNGGYARETRYLYAAQYYRVGELDLWKDNGSLKIEIRLDPGFEMTESHVHVQLDADEYQPPAAFGTWPYKKDYNPAQAYDLYTIPWEADWDGQELYIAVHAVVYGDYDDGAGMGIGKKGKWEFNWRWLWENWKALCFTARGCEVLNAAYEEGVSYDEIKGTHEWQAFMAYVHYLENPVNIQLCDTTGWVLQNDGFFYSPAGDALKPCNRLGFCLKVCFDGNLATNVFQGATYKLALKCEAVQASHYAPYHLWGITLYGTP